MKLAVLGMLLISTGVFASSDNDIFSYVDRTVKDYCSTNKECREEFSKQMLFAYKDGEQDSKSRFKNDTLIKRYERKIKTLECTQADTKYKSACDSMVDRLVDSYNRGLSNR